MAPANRILSALSRQEYARIVGGLQQVELAAGDMIQHSHLPVSTVWFPITCLVSLRAEINPDAVLEIGLSGSEGVIGIAGGRNGVDSLLTAVVQSGGSAMCIAVSELNAVLADCPGLQQALFMSMHAMMMQASQNAVCSHYHLLEARLARSLLLTRDRLQTSEFHLTHEFLGHALGVRRVGVTKAATALQTRNLISYTRGAITIVDGTGLEAAACDCYQMDRRRLETVVIGKGAFK